MSQRCKALRSSITDPSLLSSVLQHHWRHHHYHHHHHHHRRRRRRHYHHCRQKINFPPLVMTAMFEPHFRGYVRNFTFVDFIEGLPGSRKVRAASIGRGVKVANGKSNKADRGRDNSSRKSSSDTVEEYDPCLVRNPCQNWGRCVGDGHLRTVKCDCRATFHHGSLCQEG